MSRRALWGALAIGAYLAAVAVTVATGLLPVRPLYDGLAPPQPYHYVDPPPDLVEDNIEPAGGIGTIAFTPEGSDSRTVFTGDGQALAVFQQASFEPPAGDEPGEIEVEITPLGPARLPEPPQPLRLDGNAYRVEATFAGSGEAASLRREATIILRYPLHAEDMLRLEGDAWERIPTDVAAASLQLFADTKELGVFVAAGPPPPAPRGWVPYAAGGVGVAAAAAGYLIGRQRSMRSGTRAARRRRR